MRVQVGGGRLEEQDAPGYTPGNPNQTFNDTPAEKKVPALEEPGKIKDRRWLLERRLGGGALTESLPAPPPDHTQ